MTDLTNHNILKSWPDRVSIVLYILINGLCFLLINSFIKKRNIQCGECNTSVSISTQKLLWKVSRHPKHCVWLYWMLWVFSKHKVHYGMINYMPRDRPTIRVMPTASPALLLLLLPHSLSTEYYQSAAFRLQTLNLIQLARPSKRFHCWNAWLVVVSASNTYQLNVYSI